MTPDELNKAKKAMAEMENMSALRRRLRGEPDFSHSPEQLSRAAEEREMTVKAIQYASALRQAAGSEAPPAAIEPRAASVVPITAAVTTYHTGAPGRPTSKQLVADELERRIANGELASRLVDEAAYLEKWLTDVHPRAAAMKEKTIKNTFRERYREGLKIQAQKEPKA